MGIGVRHPGHAAPDVRDENLCHLFSPEKCPVVMKRSRTLEIVSNLHLQKIALKVRRDGPQPSIFVRSFSAITTFVPMPGVARRCWLHVPAFWIQYSIYPIHHHASDEITEFQRHRERDAVNYYSST